jgi:hypothetical protein
MQINITRSKENLLAIARLRKSIKLRWPRIKLFTFFICGIALFYYGGDNINNTQYSGYAMAAAIAWGAVMVLFFDNFYPKSADSSAVINNYYSPTAAATPVYKIELNDQYLISELVGNFYQRIEWNAFKSFKLYKGYILIYPLTNNITNAHIIKRDELTDEELDEFYTFLEGKMKQL